jgi:uncharacterized protein YneF (UPF0154 family)
MSDVSLILFTGILAFLAGFFVGTWMEMNTWKRKETK